MQTAARLRTGTMAGAYERAVSSISPRWGQRRMIPQAADGSAGVMPAGLVTWQITRKGGD